MHPIRFSNIREALHFYFDKPDSQGSFNYEKPRVDGSKIISTDAIDTYSTIGFYMRDVINSYEYGILTLTYRDDMPDSKIKEELAYLFPERKVTREAIASDRVKAESKLAAKLKKHGVVTDRDR